MEKIQSIKYGRITIFFAVILAAVMWGFYRTYLIFFPSFRNFQFEHHFHGALMLTWLLLLIAQPLLIKTGRIQIHKTIGRLSYIIAPLLVISIFLVARLQYHSSVSTMPLQEAVALIALNIPRLLAFAIIYSLAILNKRETPNHMRYMIGTSLLMIGPGLGRALIVYFNVSFPAAVSYTDYFTLAIAAVFLIFDLLKKRNYAPNLIVLIVIVLAYSAWQFRYTDAWQVIGKVIARSFF